MENIFTLKNYTYEEISKKSKKLYFCMKNICKYSIIISNKNNDNTQK